MPKKSKKSKRTKHFLREWREHRAMTQEQLAAALSPPTTPGVISLLENGSRDLSNKWLERLAPALRTKKGSILDVNPNEASTSILEIWSEIEEGDKARAKAILETFRTKAA